MAQNTFRQTVMSNAPQKTWQQPPELSPAAQLYTPGAAPTPTQAPAPVEPMPLAQAPVEQPQLNSFSPTREAREFFANIFGGQTAPAMTEIERNQIERGINPATQVPLSERGGSSNGLISTGTSPSLSFPVSSETEAPRVSNEPTLQSLPQSQEGAANPFEQAPSVDMGSEVAPEPAIKPQSAVQPDPNSPQANFLREKERLGGQPMNDEQIAQAESLAKHMGTTFDPVTGYSRQPFLDAQSTPQQGVQQGAGLTTVGGAPLNEFLSGAAMPEQGFARAENAMYGDNSLSRGLSGDAATKAYQDASAAREGRIGQNFGQARGPDSTDRGSGMSMEEATRLAGGDTAKAKRMIELEKQGYDPVTEQPIKGTGSAKEAAEIGKIHAETAEILSQIGEKGTELNLSPAELSRDKAAGATLNKWDDSGRATIKSNISSLNEVIEGLESGQIKTRGFIDALPFGADWARAIMNPTGQDAKDRVQGVIFQTLRETLGAQFTQKEGERLVEASYNVKLSPEQNATRLRDYTTGLKRAAEARESQMRYLKENKTLSGYEGPTPSSVMSQVGAGGEGGSPIKGDIDYQSDIQSSATEIMNSK